MDAKTAFILELRKTGLEAKSAAAAGLTPSQLRRLYESDEAFQEEALDAMELRIDDFEEEAIRRAVEGVEKPVFHQGQIVGHVIEYSDSLLTKVLMARRPKHYSDKKQLSGPEDGPLRIVIEEFSFL